MSTITVFTPAYNRAHTIERTYQSLCNQTCKDFVWMVIDDGSTDNTAELIEEWQKNDNGFEIEYYYKKNGGMHTAHNFAYEKITTELNVCIDSDDAMPENAVKNIIDCWNSNKSKDLAGIIALDGDFSYNVLGTQLPKSVKTLSTSELYGKYKATGDKKFIYRTDVIKQFSPYPVFEGERLVPLGMIYQQISEEYKMVALNEIVCLVDYQPDGSSNTIIRQYLQSPRGFAVSKIVEMKYNWTCLGKFKAAIHYVMDCRIAKDKNWFKNSPKKFLTIVAYPFGFFAEKYIIFINKNSK